jgi:hypothetical protein
VRAIVFSAALLLSLTAVPICAQNVNMAHPPEISAQHNPTPEELRSRLSNAQLQKDAKELADLCGTIPPDLDAVHQGMLPKDLLDKLNRVEKLSKRLRQELMQ